MSWILIVAIVAIVVLVVFVVLWAALAAGARADAGEWTVDPLLELNQETEQAPPPLVAVDPVNEQTRRERLDAAAVLLLAARGVLSAEQERPGQSLPADVLRRLTGAAATLETLLAAEEARHRPTGRFRRRASRPTRSKGR